jgi:GNAT superfamily N-acetyltransferase
MAALAIDHAHELQGVVPAIIVLPGGASVLIRPACTSDDTRLERMFHRLSPTTIYRWCFIPIQSPQHWAQTLANVATIDEQRQAVMVASYAGEIIGVARYDRTPNRQEAEYGIVVEDAWQARGVGKLLLSNLILEASRHQITTFSAIILGENRPALRLVSSLFDNLTIQWQQGECQVSGSLDNFKPPTFTACAVSQHT